MLPIYYHSFSQSYFAAPPKILLLFITNVGVTAGKARTNNRNKNQNWMVIRIEVSGANINNRNSVA